MHCNRTMCLLLHMAESSVDIKFVVGSKRHAVTPQCVQLVVDTHSSVSMLIADCY